MKNQVIIDEVRFTLYNFNGTGVDYNVYAYAQDKEEHDQYTVVITELREVEGGTPNEKYPVDEYWFWVDSSGNMTDDIGDDEVALEVLHILFSYREHGIIRGF